MVILEVKDLSKHFDGFRALEKIDLAIESGLIWAIIGPNGAGKTTLFNLITGILKPTEGGIYFKGAELTGMKPNKITALGIGLTFQQLRLFSKMTVLENVLVGHHCHIKTNPGKILFHLPFRTSGEEKRIHIFAEEMLDFVGLLKRKHDLVSNLSYGEQKLVALARALATGPELLLLDEPSAGLNPQETLELNRLLKVIIKQGKTICFIEHDMKMVMEISDMITVLNFGHKIAEAPPGKIKGDPQVIEAYLGAEED
jgi:branched-chain amino acid transport system ATP-binding protein